MLLATANIYMIPKVISKMFSYLIVLYELLIFFTVRGIYPLFIMIQKHKSIKKRERERNRGRGCNFPEILTYFIIFLIDVNAILKHLYRNTKTSSLRKRNLSWGMEVNEFFRWKILILYVYKCAFVHISDFSW